MPSNAAPFQESSGRCRRFGNLASAFPVRCGVRSWNAPSSTIFWNVLDVAPLVLDTPGTRLMYVMSGKLPPAASVLSLSG